MTQGKDNIGEIYALLLLGVVILAFGAGYVAGSQKTDKNK
jgi:hypothetical protein